MSQIATVQKNLTADGREKKLYSSLLLSLTIISFAAVIIFAFILAPVITYVNSDATISYLPDVFELLLQILHLVTFFVCYAITYYCIYRFPFKKSIPMIAVFSISTVCKYFLNLLSEILFAKALGFSAISGNIKKELWSVILSTVLELLQYAVVVIIAFIIFKKHKKREAMAKKGASKLGRDYDERSSVFPFKKAFSKTNPLLFSALLAALTLCLFRIAPRIYYDVFYNLFISKITLIDVIWMIAYYLSDVLFCLVGYFIMIFVFNKSDTKDLVLRAKYSE